MKKIVILIPCLNEEKGLAKVIEDIPVKNLAKNGYKTEVIVVDNNSTDKTAAVAKKKGAKVIFESKKGKGNAVRAGFAAIPKETSYVVMLDGDNTYKIHEILRLIEPLTSGFADVVIGSRLSGRYKKSAFPPINRIGNWTYAFLVRHFYQANITDALSGYYAWRKPVVDKLSPHLTSEGFSIEMEMIAKMVRLGFYLTSVPITYDDREGKSKVNQIRDGYAILFMFLRNLFSPHS